MHRTFSYKHAAKHSPKMASKYAGCENATETFTIGNGWEKSWVRMTKKDLMTIPWMKEAMEATGTTRVESGDCRRFQSLVAPPALKHDSRLDAKLFIDDCLGFDIVSVTEAGAIHLKHRENYWCESHLRILKNTKKPSRFLLMEYYREKGGEWLLDPNYPRHIHSATVSTNFGTLEDGFRVFTDGEKKYLYSRDGKERLYVPPVYDDYYCSCCCNLSDFDD
jgi:hypothetical protein